MTLLVGLAATNHATAAPPYPPNMPILSLHPANGGDTHYLSLKDLEALPTRTVVGMIPDVGDESAEWSGVSLAMLLGALGEPLPQRLTAEALDQYHEVIPYEDLERYDPIVAYQRNGEYLATSERGPLVIMYPYGEYPELLERTYYNRTVWQLHEIHME